MPAGETPIENFHEEIFAFIPVLLPKIHAKPNYGIIRDCNSKGKVL